MCTTGIINRVNLYIKNKPYFKFNGKDFITVKSGSNKFNMAKTLAERLNKAINNGKELGDVFYPESGSDAIGVGIRPTEDQLDLLNASDKESIRLAKEKLENSKFLKEFEKRKQEELQRGVSFNSSDEDTFFQKSNSEKDIVASEKTLRELGARMSDRIGIKYTFISDRTQMFKGRLKDNVATINLAYASLDTPIHEILAHPIIRAIKNSKTLTEKEFTQEIYDGKRTLEYGKGILDAFSEYLVSQKVKTSRNLYQNLLKELEDGKGKEVLDRIKRDYVYKVDESPLPLENEYGVRLEEFINRLVLIGYSTEEAIAEINKNYLYIDAENLYFNYSDEYKPEFPGDEGPSPVTTTQRVKDALGIKINERYTLEEQQEEAIVELLGLMTAEKLDNVKDGKVISLLKRLLKEIKSFIKELLKQKAVDIDKLPDNMTISDLSDLLAYSNSKLILPGYEVEYTTPDNEKFKTYEEASGHITKLTKDIKNVDLDKILLPKNIDKEIEILQKQLDNFKFELEPFNKFVDVYTRKGRLRQNYWARKKDGTTGWTGGSKETLIEPEYDGFVLDLDRGDGRFITKVSDEEAKEIYYNEEKANIFNIATLASKEKYRELENEIHRMKNNSLKGFMDKNKDYEKSKEIVEEWKKINNIKYNPEEIYSRGQEFSSVVGAYSNFDVNLMMQNLLQHIEDNEKAGGQFAISAYTKPVDKQIGHLEGGGGKIKFKIYPQSKDILWAANADVYSGSVWDAGTKVNKDKKSELLGVSYTKYPSLEHIQQIQPNLALIVDELEHHHNELGIVLTGNNFRLEYDEDIPYQTKKIIDSVNSILDQKYGKLVKPEINKITNIPDSFEYWQQDMDENGQMDRFRINVFKKENKWFVESFDTYGKLENIKEVDYNHVKLEFKEALSSNSSITKNEGIQPIQTNKNLKERIETIKDKVVKYKFTDSNISFNDYKEEQLEVWQNKYDTWHIATKEKNSYGVPIEKTLRTFSEKEKALKALESIYNYKEKDYTSQALINIKIASLKEAAKKYPRSLIRSEVKMIGQESQAYMTYLDDWQKIPSETVEVEDLPTIELTC